MVTVGVYDNATAGVLLFFSLMARAYSAVNSRVSCLTSPPVIREKNERAESMIPAARGEAALCHAYATSLPQVVMPWVISCPASDKILWCAGDMPFPFSPESAERFDAPAL